MHILFVCLGNICRSPLAEGIMREKIRKRGLNWTVASAAVGHWHIGEPPDKRAIAIAKQHGIDISQQRARLFSVKDFDQFDKIFVMDEEVYETVLRQARNPVDQVKVERMLNVLQPGTQEEVPDPYYEDKQAFETVFQILNEACEALITRELKVKEKIQ